jgi:uncharacterized repeat protein (TIGR01451 family)
MPDRTPKLLSRLARASWRRALVVLAGALAMAARPATADAQVRRAYTVRYATNDAGDIIIRGNTLATCTTTLASGSTAGSLSCASAQAGTQALNQGVNNNYVMQYVDVDGNPATFNSSTSSVTIPSGASVLFAGLYWAGRSTSAQRGSVQFRTPATPGYVTVSASTLDQNGTGTDYQGFADVTALVQAAGTGSYTVANVQANIGTTAGNDYAGWSLVIVVRDGSKPLRNLTVFDGYGNIQGGATVNTTVSGFLTPALGTPTTRVGVVSWEGDRGTGFTGDQMRVNGTALTDALSPSNDFFNSTIADTGIYVTAGQNPAFTNQMGMDAKQVKTTAVPAGATSATVTFTTSGDQYLPAVVTFLVDLFNPVINGNVVKLVTDLNGGLLAPGDTLQYDMTVRNSGQDGALNVVLVDTIPVGTKYVPGTLVITSGANAGAKTDATADDQGDFDQAGTKRAVFRLGTGANGTAGGSLAPGATAAVRFRVTVDSTLAAGTVITNQAVVTAISQTLGSAINARSRDSLTGGGGTPPTNVAVAGPNLTVTKTHPADPSRGGSVTYAITVSNVGNAGTTNAPIVMTDTVPAPMVPTAATGSGWSCTITGQVVSCTLSGGLAASSAAAPISLVVAVPVSAPASFTNVARVAGGGDNTPGNNSASDLTVTIAVPDLQMAKRSAATSFTIGSPATWSLVAKNVGSAPASDSMRVIDTLPAGLAFTSATGGGFTCTNTGQVVSCFRPAGTPVAVGDSVVITLVTNVLAAAAPAVSNRARVNTPLDPVAANNVATSAAIPVLSPVDLTLAKTATSVFSVGQNATYSLVVTNAGGQPTTGAITLVDTLSNGLTFVSASGGNFTCTSAAPLVTCTRPAAPALAGGAQATVTLTVAVAAAALPTVNNLARVLTAGDQNATNDTAKVVATPVIGVPDLAMTKTATGTLAVGQPGTFLLSINNLGSAATTGAITLTDTLAAGLAFTSGVGPGFTCSAAGQVVTCTSAGPIAAGGNAGIVLTVTPSAAAIPGVVNRAWVATPGDGNAANNVGTTGTVGVVSVPDLAMTKAFTGSMAVGGTASWILTVKNVSPGPTTGAITITDLLPTGLTFVSGTGGNFSCGATGQNVSCTRPASPVLVPGDSAVVTLVVSVDSTAGAAIVNRASSTTAGDVNFTNDTATSASRTVTRPDLAITKSHTPATWSVGVPATWTLSVTNAGTAPTIGTITLVDTLPANVAFTSTTGAGWSCATTGVVATGQVVTCTNAGPIPVGGTSTLQVTATAQAAAIGTATNVARVSTPGESNLANNRATDPTPVVGVPDLAVFKSHSGAFVTGQTATYTILVQNVGSAATSATITVTDTLPAGLTFASGTGGGFTCANVAQVVTCTSAGPIAAAASASISLVVNVLPAALPSVQNTVRVSTPGDVNATNDFGQDSPALVIASPDLAISKAPDSAFVIGRVASWTVAVQNVSPGSQAGPITVTDTLPLGLTYRATGSGGGGFTCSLAGTTGGGRDIASCTAAGPIAANTTVRFSLFVNVGAAAFGSTTNTIDVSAPGDLNPTNDRFTTGPVSISSIPDLALAKAPTGSVIVNDTVTFTMSVTNVSAGPTTGAITVRDSLAAGLTYEATGSGGSGFTCAAAGQIVTCTSAGPIASGAVVQFPLRATVAVGAFPTVFNKASVATAGDFNAANDTATTANLPVTSVPDFTITKTGSGPINVGGPTTFTITLTNVSPVAAGQGGNSGAITVTDTLPAGLTFVSGTDSAATFGCSVTGTASGRDIVTCTRPAPPTRVAITAGQAVSIALVANVAASALGTITNAATVSTPGDVNPGNNRSQTAPLAVVAPDLTLAKVALTPFLRAQNASYQLTVSNVGTGATTGAITVTDTLAPGIGFVSAAGTGWSCSAAGALAAGPTVTCTSAGPIAAAGTSVLTLTVLVDATAANTVSNTATVQTPNDVNTANNRVVLAGTTVSGAPDLAVTKVAAGSFIAAQPASWRVVLKNVGSIATTDTARLVDTLPAGVTFTSATSSGGACAVAGNVVTCKRPPPLAAGDSDVVTIAVQVGAAAVPAVTNRAWGSTTGDANAANNVGTATTTVTTAPDLQLAKAGPATLIAGVGASYTLVARNVGSAPTSGNVQIADTLAAGLQYVFASGSGFTCGVTGQVMSCSRTTPILVGDSAVVTLATTVSAGATGTLGNRATVTAIGDPNLANNGGTAPTAPVNTAPDLALAKAAQGSFIVGRAASFRLVARNVGTGATSGAITLTDNLPTGLQFVSGAGTNWSCGAAGQVVTCTNPGPVAPGDSAVVTLTVNVLAGALPSVINSATVSTPGDPTPANDASATPAIPVVVAPDVTITKTSLFASHIIGDTAQFRLLVTNVGSGPTTGPVTITDTLPAGMTGLGALTVPPSTFTCGAVGTLVTCTRNAVMNAGDTASVVIGAAIGAGTASPMRNRAWVATAGDPGAANDSASSAPVPVTATPNLALVKRAVGTFTVGQPGTFQLVVRNTSLSPTTGTTTLIDTLPTGLTFASGTGTGWSCTTPGNPAVANCTRPTPILAGDSAIVTLTVNVAASALPSVNNRARVSTPGEVFLTDNVALSGAVPVTAAPDLQMTKSAVGSFTVGSPATYTLTVRNVGTGVTVDSIIVLDSLPASLAFTSATGPNFTCAQAAGVVRCVRPASSPLAVNATAAITVIVTPLVAAVPSVTNVARVTTTGDATPGNDRAAIATPVSGQVNVALAKTGGDTVSVGASATWTLTVSNIGSLPAPVGFTVVDSLPAGTTFQSASGAGFTCSNASLVVTCTATAALAAGASTPISVQAVVTKAAFPGVTNRARVTVGGDVDTTDNRATKATVVRGTVDVDVKKAAGSAQFTSGIDNTWILTVANRGNVPTTGTVTVVDTLPAGLTFSTGTATGWSCSAAGQVVTCASSTPIPDADSVLITLKTKAATTLTGTVTNCATGAAPLDANPANNRSCASVAVIGDFRLSIQKVSRAQVVDVGGTNDYTVVVKNIGASPVPAVQLNDVLPAGFSYQLGTSRIEGTAAPDPAGGAGPSLSWPLGLLNPGEQRTVTYRVKIGPNLRNGNAINKASASSGTLVVQANNAAAAVVVRRGVFTDRGVIAGKVFAHCDCGDSTRQQAGELGIPGVRVYLEDGTSAITDVEGKYNFWDASSGMHVVKVDATTLPAGARLVVMANRNALDPNSRFVDLKGGQLAIADFATAFDAEVIAQVRERRRRGEPEAPIVTDLAAKGPQAAVRRATDGPVDALMGAASASATVGAAVPAAGASVPAAGTVAPTAGSANAAVTSGGAANAAPAASAATTAPTTRPAPAAPAPSPAVERVAEGTPVMEGSRWEGMREGEGASAVLPATVPPVALPVLTDRASNLPPTPLAAADRVPGAPRAGRVELVIAGTAYPADGASAIPVVVRVYDADGKMAQGNVPVTLEASLGRWLVDDVDADNRGTQAVVTNGERTFRLKVPGQPGKGELRVTSPSADATVPLTFVPASRPLVVAGVINGRVDFSSFTGGSLVTSAPDAAFESRLASWSFTQDSGKVRGGMRAAFFAKGDVGAGKLLTLGFDSERDDNGQQFRDISPEEMYPTYGDGSLREFDGQSQRRLYARLDRGASFTRFGDYVTQRAGETRLLGTWDRTLNGLQHHEEGGFGNTNVYLARGTARQVIDELPGRGISGPYFLSKPNAVINSERVELLTRDRNQPALILATKPMARFADYTVEPFTGRLLFRAPVPSLDANLNPVSIRVTYEIDQGGAAYNTYGADATFNIGSRLSVGGIAALDENPTDSLKLFGANASLKLTDKTVALVEVAQATGMAGQDGRAGRFEVRHQSDGIEARLYGTRAGLGFANRSATFGTGRQELGFRGTVALGQQSRLLAEAIETEDLRTGGKRDGALVSLERTFAQAIRAEVGYRYAKETGAASAATTGLLVPPSFSAVRAKLTARLPGSERSSLFAEAERDVGSSLMRASVGGEYGFATRARAYVRHEWVDGFAGPYALTGGQAQQNTVFGVDADYLQNANVFSEYRERDAINGRDAEASIGLRNRWALGQGLLFNTTLERVAPLAGVGRGNATAVTGALEWTRPATTKMTLRAEWRRSSGEDGYLFSAGIAEKLARDWTLLTRGLFDQQPTVGDRLRTHVGLAWRQTDRTDWNGLLHYEFRRENLVAGLQPASGYDAHIVAGLLNWQPSSRLVLSGRLAAKFATDRSQGFTTTSDAQLVMGRATYDLTQRWDVGTTASWLISDGNAARQYGLGFEVGRIVMKNLRLAAGYNLFGYRDRDLSAFGYSMKGAYLDFAFKFDESLFGRGSTPAPAGK